VTDSQELVTICAACDKKIVEGRSGSLTQWIFADHICKCENPRPVAIAQSRFRSETRAFEQEASFDASQVIDIDSNLFPTERYKPLELLGQGGLGQVYLCWDVHLRKRVAVKSLLAIIDENVVSFQQEAKIASRLNYDHVIKVYDFGTISGGRPYMVMEYFRGRSLLDVIEAHGRINEQEARIIFAKVCDALDHLHEQQVYHRDLKPSNILIRFDEDQGDIDIRLIDFGLSKTTVNVQSKTLVQGRTVVGTPTYMPPDQVKGHEYDARSEIYSLGCSMYEALTGNVPFTGETALQILNNHVNEPHVPMQEYELELTDGICDIVDRCLEKEPADRFQTARDLLDAIVALEEIQPAPEDEEDKTEAAASVAKPSSSMFRSKWFLVGAAVLVVGLGALFIPYFATQTPHMPIAYNGDEIGVSEDKVLKNKKRARVKTNERSPELDLRNYGSIEDLKGYAGNRHVKRINLADTDLDDSVFPYLARIPNLEVLDLTATKVKTLEGVKKLRRLKQLNLNETQISDDALDNLRGMEGHLQQISLCSTSITVKGLEKLLPFRRLAAFAIERTPLDPSAIDVFRKMEALKYLSVRDTGLGRDDIVRLLKDNPKQDFINVTFGTVGKNDSSLRNDFPTVDFNDGAVIKNERGRALKALRRGNHEKALKITQGCFDLAAQHNNIRWQEELKAQMANIYAAMGRDDLAVKESEGTIEFSKKNKSPRATRDAAYSVFSYYCQKGDFSKAERFADEYLAAAADVFGAKSNEYCTAQLNVANYYIVGNQADLCLKVIVPLRRSYERRFGSSDGSFFATMVAIEGRCMYLKKQNAEAIRLFNEAIDCSRKSSTISVFQDQRTSNSILECYLGLTQIYISSKDYATARKYNDEAEMLVQEHNFAPILQERFWRNRLKIGTELKLKEQVEAATAALAELKKGASE